MSDLSIQLISEIMSGKKYLAGTSKNRKSSIIQKILPTDFSFDDEQEFSNIGPNYNTGILYSMHFHR